MVQLIGEAGVGALYGYYKRLENPLEHMERVQIPVDIGMLDNKQVSIERITLHHLTDLHGKALRKHGLHVREEVGYVDDKLVINPTLEQRKNNRLN